MLREFGDQARYEAVEAELGRSLTLHEVISQEFATVRAPLEAVVDFVVDRAVVRRGFRELAASFDPLVVSAGFHELIEPVLEREGVELEVQANRVEPRPEGWRVVFRDGGDCATCSEPCKRAVLPSEDFVFVGDGYSDRCAALAASRVFAIGSLADYLAERGTPFEHFSDFYDLGRALARDAIPGG